MDNEELQSFVKVWTTAMACLIYAYYLPSRLPKGLYRLISLVPVLTLFTLLPFRLHTITFSGSTAFFLIWLSNFKLLLFAFDHGQLTHFTASKSLPQFLSLAALPINLKRESPPNPFRKNATVPFPIRIFLFLLTFLIYQLEDYKTQIHPIQILILYCYNIYIITDIVVSISSIPIRTFLGLDLAPQFDEPYLSASLQDFWSRRWNLAVPALLHATIYDPMVKSLSKELGRRPAKLVAVVAAFGVSGLMHELIFYVMMRAAPSWEVTGFFLLHGVCVAAEVEVKRAVGRFRVPRMVSTPLTLGFVAWTAQWLFFPPIVRNGADERMIGEWLAGLKFVLGY